jgi:hypothetical protein
MKVSVNGVRIAEVVLDDGLPRQSLRIADDLLRVTENHLVFEFARSGRAAGDPRTLYAFLRAIELD